MTVEEMLSRMSSREFAEWQAYARVEPFGEERADARSAIVAATVANVARDPKKPPIKVEAFIPFRTPKVMGWREILDRLKQAWGS